MHLVTQDERVADQQRVTFHDALVAGVQLGTYGQPGPGAPAAAAEPGVMFAHDDLEDSPLWQAHRRSMERSAMRRRN
jgi:hypothetical protein